VVIVALGREDFIGNVLAAIIGRHTPRDAVRELLRAVLQCKYI
jgi:hypothetical protein